MPPDAGGPPTVPEELDELIRGASRERAVRPVGRVRTVRTTTLLLSDDDLLLAQVRHDQVTLATLGLSTDVESWTEVELRVDAAGPPLVTELERRLAEAGVRSAAPAAEAELDRLLQPAPSASTGRRPGRKASAGAVLQHYLAIHVGRLAAEDLRARRGEPDAVHQLRVAARRVRSALKAYRPLLDSSVPAVGRDHGAFPGARVRRGARCRRSPRTLDAPRRPSSVAPTVGRLQRSRA